MHNAVMKKSRGSDSLLDPSRETLIGPIEAARLLNVNPSTIQRWIDAGHIPAHRTTGGHRRVSRKDLTDFARRNRIPFSRTPGRRESLLIVDDEIDLLEMLKVRIRALLPDVEVLTAESGFEAGLAVSFHRPALVLLDIRMPGMNGVEVCRSIKADPQTASTRIVGITALRDPVEIGLLRQAGAEDVLLKPIEPDALREILVRVFPREENVRAV